MHQIKKADDIQFMASIARSIQDPVITTDHEMKITTWNAAAENLLGWKSDEVIGKKASEILQPSYPFKTSKQILDSFTKEGHSSGEVIYHTKKGRPINFFVSISQLLDESGNHTGNLVLPRNITEQKKEEEQLAYMARLAAGTSETVYSVTPDFTIRTWNKSAEKLYGYTAEEAIGQPTFSIVRSRMDEKQRLEIRKEIIENGFWEGELEHLTKDGSSIFVLASATATRNENGEIEGYVSVARNITERKKLEEQLKNAHREMEAFIYSVSHDLRAPLRSVIGFSTMLEEDYSSMPEPEIKRLTAVIRNSALRMNALIDDLLSFFRMGTQQLVKAEVDTNILVETILGEIAPKDTGNKIAWNIGNLPAVRADLSTIRQVWINLISNAIKYSGKKEKPHIEIGSFNESRFIVFYVKDNGVGFDEKYKDKLFNVFQRLHSPNDFEGTGVGLALVQKIVLRHGGKVRAEGKVGEGATFYFSLPL
ncbi:MAG: PAS domain S-box protein [Bacteroidota bacterium]